MNYGQSILSGFRKYVTFSGRASRSEFWWWTFFNFFWIIIHIAAFVLVTTSDLTLYWKTIMVYYFLLMGTCLLILPDIAVFVRRAHDSGHSGWWILCPIFNFILMFFPSSEGENKYGKLKN